MPGRVQGREDAMGCHLHVHIRSESGGCIYCRDSGEICVLSICICVFLCRASGYEPGPVRCKDEGADEGSGSLCVEGPRGTSIGRRAGQLCSQSSLPFQVI